MTKMVIPLKEIANIGILIIVLKIIMNKSMM